MNEELFNSLQKLFDGRQLEEIATSEQKLFLWNLFLQIPTKVKYNYSRTTKMNMAYMLNEYFLDMKRTLALRNEVT